MLSRALLLLGIMVSGSICLTPQQHYHIPVAIPATTAVHFKYQDHIDGSYHFGYDTGLMQQHSFREEVRLADGQVRGQFGYVDPQGALRVTHYSAGSHGYRAIHTIHYLVNKDHPKQIIGPIPYLQQHK